jgi:hypothetical protein
VGPERIALNLTHERDGMKIQKKLVDLAERTGATFAQAFLAAITVDATGITQVSALKVAAVAGGYAVAKFLLLETRAYLASPEPPAAPRA